MWNWFIFCSIQKLITSPALLWKKNWGSKFSHTQKKNFYKKHVIKIKYLPMVFFRWFGHFHFQIGLPIKNKNIIMVIIDFKEFLITTYLAEWMKKKTCACNLPTYNWIWTLFGCSFILKIVHTHTSNHKIIDFVFFLDKRILNIHFFKVLREEQWIKLQCNHTSQFTDFVLNEKFVI